MGLRVLFLTPSPVDAANTRYRVCQYLPYLRSRGIESEIAPFISSEMFRDLYMPGQFVRKAVGMTRSALSRAIDVTRARRADVICILREAMLFGPPVIEWLVHQVARRPIVFDFDDAVFVPYVSPTYGRLASWLKYPAKSSHILEMSAHVMAGNEYLANYARRYNNSVTILPTVVDTERYAKSDSPGRENSRAEDNRKSIGGEGSGRIPVIGWIGSHSTAQYLDLIAPALQRLSKQRPFLFRVIGAGKTFNIPGVNIENREWALSTEIQDFHSLDIGVYPIRDDDWSRGKCAFKAIQYMAAGVPCVSSPVGMTTEVIQNRSNGFLADSTPEWVSSLEALLDDELLRERLSREGRLTIEKKYSLKEHAPRLANVLEEAAGRGAN